MTSVGRVWFRWRNGVLLLLAALALGPGPWRPEAAVAAGGPAPNIIFILADDLGYGDLGCYGQKRIKTPNLDQLAAEGIRFTDFYAGSTVCAPSRCVLMTGLNTGHGWVRGNGTQALRPEDVTVAEVLRAAGYHTGCIGKWGLGSENSTGVPQRQGFDEFAGYLDQAHAHDYYTDHIWRYDPRTGYDASESLAENWGGQKKLYLPDLFTRGALNFVRVNRPDRFNRRPFFLYLAYTTPHANNEEAKRTGNGMEVPSDAPYSTEPWPQPERNKAAMITRMDADIGRLLDKLTELKQADNTVVFFTSDNGPHREGGVDPKFFESAGPLRGHKRDLYEGGIRVPLIARWPGVIQPGQVSTQAWSFCDMLPTLAAIGRAKTPEKLDGISMLPALLGQPQTNQHAFLYWEFHERGFQQAVRMGKWKAVRLAAGKPLELYDLQADPRERLDVAKEHADVAARIEDCLKTARTESKEWPIRPAQNPAPATPEAKR
jgi:arylsulfatase A-like enzyme